MNLSSQANDATDAVQQILSMIESITELLRTPAGWITLIILLFWLIANKDLSHVLKLFGSRKKLRLEHLDRYTSTASEADDKSRQALLDLRDAYYFEIATGIYAEKAFRNSLIFLHDHTSYLINWGSIRQAIPYLKINETGELSIRKMTTVEILFFWYNKAVGFTSLFLAAAFLSAFALSTEKTAELLLLSIVGSVVTFVAAMYIFSLNWPVRSAKKIREEMEK